MDFVDLDALKQMFNITTPEWPRTMAERFIDMSDAAHTAAEAYKVWRSAQTAATTTATNYGYNWRTFVPLDVITDSVYMPKQINEDNEKEYDYSVAQELFKKEQ